MDPPIQPWTALADRVSIPPANENESSNAKFTFHVMPRQNFKRDSGPRSGGVTFDEPEINYGDPSTTSEKFMT